MLSGERSWSLKLALHSRASSDLLEVEEQDKVEFCHIRQGEHELLILQVAK
jgi:hypothetical protein